MTIFDSSVIEDFVTENNSKYANRIIIQLKAYEKFMNYDKSYIISTVVERDINHIKDNLCLTGHHTQNGKYYTPV